MFDIDLFLPLAFSFYSKLQLVKSLQISEL